MKTSEKIRKQILRLTNTIRDFEARGSKDPKGEREVDLQLKSRKRMLSDLRKRLEKHFIAESKRREEK